MTERAKPAMHVKQREHAFAMEADDDVVVVDRSGSKMFTLNNVGGILWNHIDQPTSPEELVTVLAERWPDLDPAGLRADVDIFLAEAIEAGIVVVEL